LRSVAFDFVGNVAVVIDNRHSATIFNGTGFTKDTTLGTVTINENGTPRTYDVWTKTITSGSTVNFPRIGANTAPCYFIVAF
jgi:hypothetical protein